MKPRILFIDRDGTLIDEPKTDFQVDAFEKLAFLPYAISALQRVVRRVPFKLVMVTNQDGLGTDSFPEDTFWPVHNLMLQILEGEGIRFDDMVIDRTFESDKAPTRKPGTALLTEYLKGDYDLENSFVIGDRLTDVQLAKNLGCQSIYIAEEKSPEATFTSNDWNGIADFLIKGSRKVVHERNTSETEIRIALNLDGEGTAKVSTGLGFFDHMLDQLARHGGMDLEIDVKGDLHIDEHHTIEDTALALGEAFKKALGDKRGLQRYGFALPMDESEAHVTLDFGGRPWLVWDVEFKRDNVGEMPTEMVSHFFKSFADAAACNLNVKATGSNDHHKIEAIFKAWSRAIRMAKAVDEENLSLPSTKGIL